MPITERCEMKREDEPRLHPQINREAGMGREKKEKRGAMKKK
jgi:hypothetical protein